MNEPLYVFWRERSTLGLGAWSRLCRTIDGRVTLCKEPVRSADPERRHVGVRIRKRAPKPHALAVCRRCESRVLVLRRRAERGQ
jgi:hypothetical protein